MASAVAAAATAATEGGLQLYKLLGMHSLTLRSSSLMVNVIGQVK